MKKIWILAAVLLMTMLLSVNVSRAAMPARLSYQGALYLKDGTPVDTQKKLTFRLYTVETGGTAFWTEAQNSVTVTKGHYSTILGITSPLNIGSFTGNTWLGISVDSDAEMTPREQLTSVPFAFNGVPQGGIIMWSGTIANIPSGWALCDGNNGTPNLKDKFILGAGGSYAPSGGATSHSVALSVANMPQHSHTTSFILAGYDSGGDNLNEVLRGHAWWPNAGTATFTTTPAGSGTAFTVPTMPPYYALAYIMKL